jgi:hypothetical protein
VWHTCIDVNLPLLTLLAIAALDPILLVQLSRDVAPFVELAGLEYVFQ